MKHILFILFIIVIMPFSNAQNDTIYKPYSNQYQDYFKRVTFKIGGGVLLPQGDLSKYFGVSPLVELSLDFPVTEKKSLQFGLQFIVPDQKQPFKYVRTLDTIQAKASFMINPMLRFNKNLSQKVNNQFYISLGIGASIIKTDARNPFYSGNEDEEKYEVVTALLLSPNLDYVKKFRNNEELTFSIGLNYTPYKIEGALRQNIGSLSLTPRILYSF